MNSFVENAAGGKRKVRRRGQEPQIIATVEAFLAATTSK